MIGCYRSVLSTPGALSFTAAGLLIRLPMTMVTLGTLLLVHERTGSYALAGAVTAVSGVAFGIASPIIGRAVDRLGQARVLRPTVVVHATAMLSLVAACVSGMPLPLLFVLAVFSGATAPSIGTLLRARWSHVLSAGRVQTAYALESSLDELLFLIGPALISIVAVAASPAWGLSIATVATVVGALWLSRQHGTAPPSRQGRGQRARLRAPGVAVVALVLTAVGALCGSISVLVTAFTRDHASLLAAGPVLSMWAAGSLLSGLAYGARTWRLGLASRFGIAVALLSVGVVPLAFADTVLTLSAAMFLAGATIAPTLITGYSLASSLVPAADRTQGLAWASTGMSLSAAGAGALAGYLIDAFSISTAFTVSVLTGPLALLVTIAGWKWLHSGPPLQAVSALPAHETPQAAVSLSAAA